MKELSNIKSVVLETLIEKPKTRDNDIELMYQVLRKMGLSTDIRELKKLHSNILETIRRSRCMLQKENPRLVGDAVKSRRNKEEKYRRFVKGV